MFKSITAWAVVPDPANESRTISLFLASVSSIRRFTRATGLTVSKIFLPNIFFISSVPVDAVPKP
jgi:hypothetical protein